MIRPQHGGNIAWAAALAGCPPSDILDFSASINPLGPPKSALEGIQGNLSGITAYPDPDYQGLKTALCQVHPGLDPDWVLPGNGAAELLTWAALDLSKLAATYLVTPAFGDYWRALKTFEVNVLECPLSMEEVRGERQEGIWEFGLQPSPSIGFLLNNPHNPTGQLFGQQRILPYLEEFALVVVDEAFMDFLPPAQQQSLVSQVAAYPNLVILRSLTKFYSLPGLRLGYAIAHPDRLRRWQQWRDPWPVNSLAAAAGIAGVQDRAFQQQTWDWLDYARPKLFHGLAQIPGLQPYPSAANFLLVYSQLPVDWLQRTLLEREQILIRDTLSFPELGNHYFRVAVRTPEENHRLTQGLIKILQT